MCSVISIIFPSNTINTFFVIISLTVKLYNCNVLGVVGMEDVFVKMSPKGQLVVPLEIRDDEGFKPGDRFVSFPVKNGILFKKVRMPSADKEFKELLKNIEDRFKRTGIVKGVIEDAIKWARKK